MKIVQTNNADVGAAVTSRAKLEKHNPSTHKKLQDTLGVRAHIDMLTEAQERFKTQEDTDPGVFQFKN